MIEAQKALERLEDQEEVEEKQHQEWLLEKDLQDLAVNRIIHVLGHSFGLNPEFGDHEKLDVVADYIVRDLGIRDPDYSLKLAFSMVAGRSGRHQPIDALYESVMNAKAQRRMLG